MIRWLRKHKTDLEQALGYRFTDRELLQQALTHPSFRAETSACSGDNQRLEFLGDAVLGLVAAEWLYHHFPGKPEGELTRMRSALTSGQTLSDIGQTLEIGAMLRMGKGETASGGTTRPSNLTDAVEALIGGAWLDGGLPAAEAVFHHVFAERLTRIGRDVKTANPKGRLQEYCQKHWSEPPAYRIAAETGPSHSRRYNVIVQLPDGRHAEGHGSGKRSAETEAAAAMLERISQEPPPES